MLYTNVCKYSHEHMIDYEFTNNNHDPLFQTFLNDIGCFNFEKEFQNIFVLRKHSKLDKILYICG